MAKLQRDLEKQFSAGVKVPAGGSEADAIKNVKDQLNGMGVTSSDAEAAKIVRATRKR
jgi:hypothetical protein